jgi:hypothetical protein
LTWCNAAVVSARHLHRPSDQPIPARPHVAHPQAASGSLYVRSARSAALHLAVIGFRIHARVRESLLSDPLPALIPLADGQPRQTHSLGVTLPSADPALGVELVDVHGMGAD